MPFCELDLEQNKNEITTILINEVMRKKQVKKSYSAPECMIIQVNEATYLMDTSFPSQHNPAQPGGTISNAKAMNDWEELESKGGIGSSFSWED